MDPKEFSLGVFHLTLQSSRLRTTGMTAGGVETSSAADKEIVNSGRNAINRLMILILET
jgi:hypothetical protein